MAGILNYECNIMPFVKFLLILILFPLNASAALEIGVGTHFNNYGQSPDKYIKLINDCGFTSVRDGFSWNSVLIKPGSMNISRKTNNTDMFFSNESKFSKQRNNLFVLGYGSDIYTHGYYPQSKEEVDRFVDYVSWVVNRYKRKVKYYEVWNEWIQGTGVKSKINRPDDKLYLYLVQQSYKKIKEIDPDAIVLTGSINPLHKNEVDWLNNLIAQGLLNYVDGISIHPYAFNERKSVRDPEGSFIALDSFEKSLFEKSGKNLPLYITEMGYPTGNRFHGGISQANAAQNILKYNLLAASRSYIKGLWWYDLKDDGSDYKNKEHNFGIFYANDEVKESAQLIKSILPILIKSSLTVVDEDNKSYVVISKGAGQLSWLRGNNYSLQEWKEKIDELKNPHQGAKN